MNNFERTEYIQSFGVTKEASTVSINFSNAMNSYIGKSVFVSQKIGRHKFKEFIKLKNKWKEETLFISSGTIIISNVAYKEIIGLGNIAIPWIIRELRKTNDHWFYALEQITDENPIKEEHIGIIEEMKNDWINWASNKNYV